MKFDLENMSKEDLDALREKLLTVARSYEPWADGMNLGGAGDPGVDHFPLDLFSEEVESITITGVKHEQAEAFHAS